MNLLFLFLFSWTLMANDFVLRSNVSSPMPDPPPSDQLSVLWWNIGCSSTKYPNPISEEEKKDLSPESSWLNLKNLVESEYQPSILILGEYCPYFFNSKTQRLLEGHYPYIHTIEKSNPEFKIRNGLIVFSHFPIQVKKEVTLTHGDFYTHFLKKHCLKEPDGKDALWTRRLSILEVQGPDGSFQLAPVHLANPWREVLNCKGLGGLAGEILHGTENVNYKQSLELIELFDKEKPSLLIGDFNAVKRAFFNSHSYKSLKEHFGPSLIEDSTPTYFDPQKRFPNSIIDHAFSIKLEPAYAQTLPLAGSDHLPILVSF